MLFGWWVCSYATEESKGAENYRKGSTLHWNCRPLSWFRYFNCQIIMVCEWLCFVQQAMDHSHMSLIKIFWMNVERRVQRLLRYSPTQTFFQIFFLGKFKTSRSIYSFFLESSQGAQFNIKKVTQNFDFSFYFVTPMKNFSMSLHKLGFLGLH